MMRLFVNIYYGMTFLSLSQGTQQDIFTDEDITQLPSYLAFMQGLGSGAINLSERNSQRQLGFIFLHSAKALM